VYFLDFGCCLHLQLASMLICRAETESPLRFRFPLFLSHNGVPHSVVRVGPPCRALAAGFLYPLSTIASGDRVFVKVPATSDCLGPFEGSIFSHSALFPSLGHCSFFFFSLRSVLNMSFVSQVIFLILTRRGPRCFTVCTACLIRPEVLPRQLTC